MLPSRKTQTIKFLSTFLWVAAHAQQPLCYSLKVSVCPVFVGRRFSEQVPNHAFVKLSENCRVKPVN